MHLPLVKEYKEQINVTLKRSQHSHFNNVIFSHLIINSIRNKFGEQEKRHKMNLFPMISSYISATSPFLMHIIQHIKDNMLLRNQKFYKGIKNPIFIRTFASK